MKYSRYKEHRAVHSDAQTRAWAPISQFADFAYWNKDYEAPSHQDPVHCAMRFLDVCDALHGPVTPMPPMPAGVPGALVTPDGGRPKRKAESDEFDEQKRSRLAVGHPVSPRRSPRKHMKAEGATAS